MKKKSILLPVLLTLLASSYASVFACDAKIDNLAKNFMLKNNITGTAIAIINKDKVEYCNYGYTDKDKKQKITQYSIFSVGSITKTFVATLAAIANVEGKLNLYAPINKYLIDLNKNSNFNKISIIDLLTHVSGLPFKILPPNKTVISEAQLLTQLYNYTPPHTPQTVYQYSNLGITLVGLALERNYHQSFQQMLQNQLWGKLNMKYTFLTIPKKYKNLVVTGYNTDDTPYSSDILGVYNIAGGLKSNAYDLSKYIQLQINGTRDTTINKALSILHKNYYCLGYNGEFQQQLVWEYKPQKNLKKTFHLESAINVKSIKSPYTLTTHCADNSNGFVEKTGNISGMSSYLAYIPSKKVGVVVLMNKSHASEDINLGRSILQLY